jgi:hypothetical protein
MKIRAQIRWVLILILGLQTVVFAAPQAQSGDVGLRHDIQVLADYGAISGPVTTWPISWDAVLADLEAVKANDVVLPNKVLPTFERVLARAQRETRRGEFAFKAAISAADSPTNIRSFADTPREEGEIRVGGAWFSDNLSIDLNASYADNPADEEDVRADGSQLGVDLGNWSIAASTYDRWWGPGWDGSLILSNNADLQVMFGQLEEERAIPDAQFFGMRLNFRPLKGLEFGISRSAQWCGEGRPCDFSTFWDLLLGKDNIGDDDIGEDNEPGNQMAGFDVRWTNMWFGTPVSLYGQMIGEDEAGGFPSRYLAQFGIEGSGITQGQTSFRWFLEAAGTSCDVVKSEVRYNCGYRQSIYESGYTYYGRIIGHGLDNDALVYSAGLVIVSSEGNTWQFLGRTGELNRVGADPDHSVAVVPQDLVSFDVQHSRSTKIGRFDYAGVSSLDESLKNSV